MPHTKLTVFLTTLGSAQPDAENLRNGDQERNAQEASDVTVNNVARGLELKPIQNPYYGHEENTPTHSVMQNQNHERMDRITNVTNIYYE